MSLGNDALPGDPLIRGATKQASPRDARSGAATSRLALTAAIRNRAFEKVEEKATK